MVPKFVQIKVGGFSFWGEPICQNVWIIWCPLQYLSLKSPMDPNFESFIRFQLILHESGRLFSESWSFYKLKRGDLISGVNQFCRMSEIFGPPFCISILKPFLDQNSSPIIRFQCILYDSGILPSKFSNFYKLKRGVLLSGANQYRRMSELFGLPICIFVLKVLWTKILPHSLDFSSFCMNKEGFSHSPEVSPN